MISVDLERHVIGAAMLDAALEAAKLVSPQDFADPRHGVILSALTRLAFAGKSADLVSLAQELRDTGKLGQAGGEAYLLEISAEVVSSAWLEDHAAKVRELAARRKAKALLTAKAREFESGENPVAKILSEIETGLAEIRSSGEMAFGLRRVPKPEWQKLAADSYDERIYHGESTGWPELDKTFRVAPGQLNVVTGVPNHGKSEWLDALMLNLAKGSGWRVAFLSPENSPLRRHIQKLAEKLVGKRLYGPGRMTRLEFESAVNGFIADRFEFMDQGINGATIDQVLNEARRIKPEINALVVDPWNRLERGRKEGVSETDYICECLTRASRFAQSTGISVWIVAHPMKLRRNKDGEEQKPGLYDISGSAHWNNITDNGIMVWRNFQDNTSEVHVLKVRFKDNGTPGVVVMRYERESGRYRAANDHDTFYPEIERQFKDTF
jgi:replicative DNA helicase